MPEQQNPAEKVYRGIAVSGGVCRGPVYLLEPGENCIPHLQITAEEIGAELERLERALIETRQQILKVQEQVERAMGAEDASIFDAHLLVLEDQTLLDEVNRYLNTHLVNVEYAFNE